MFRPSALPALTLALFAAQACAVEVTADELKKLEDAVAVLQQQVTALRAMLTRDSSGNLKFVVPGSRVDQVGGSRSEAVARNLSESTGGSHTLSVGGSAVVQVQQSRSTQLGGSESVSVGGSQS